MKVDDAAAEHKVESAPTPNNGARSGVRNHRPVPPALIPCFLFVWSRFRFEWRRWPAARVIFAVGYVSGSAISSTATWLGQSFASLGIVAGTSVYTSPSDNITINVGPAVPSVPEPATWLMMLLGFGAAGIALRLRSATVGRLAAA